jgi:hypothetical protein
MYNPGDFRPESTYYRTPITVKSPRQARKVSDDRSAKQGRMPKRNAIVVASLLAALVFTSILLLTLSPPPLAPDAARRLFALDQPDALDTVTSLQPGRWQAIYIHHSKTRSGDAGTVIRGGMGDHFLVGNGQGCEDGEVQVGQRWLHQQPARLALPAPAGSAERTITVCLVGDLDRTAPTPAQVRQLEQLVQTLQRKLNIPAKAVLAFDQPNSSLGIGRLFPARDFAQHLLP